MHRSTCARSVQAEFPRVQGFVPSGLVKRCLRTVNRAWSRIGSCASFLALRSRTLRASQTADRPIGGRVYPGHRGPRGTVQAGKFLTAEGFRVATVPVDTESSALSGEYEFVRDAYLPYQVI